jgi:uncharacterized protein YjbJ (UPF0337 family)
MKESAGRWAVPGKISRIVVINPTRGGIAMNKDQVKGAVKEVAGKVQQKTGKLLGNTGQEAKGFAKKVEGKAQKKVGKVKEALKGAIDKL